MSRYRKVSTAIWGDERFRRLDDDGRFVFLFLLTHPHLTCLGAMRATVAGLAAEFGWSTRRFGRAIRQLVALGMVALDAGVGFLALPKFLNHNEPQGPNSVVRGWLLALEELPECGLRRHLARRALAYLEGRSPAFRQQIPELVFAHLKKAGQDPGGDGIRHAIGDGPQPPARGPSDIQEQEQEQDPPHGGAGTVRREGGRSRRGAPTRPPLEPAGVSRSQGRLVGRKGKRPLQNAAANDGSEYSRGELAAISGAADVLLSRPLAPSDRASSSGRRVPEDRSSLPSEGGGEGGRGPGAPERDRRPGASARVGKTGGEPVG